jgi:hypothetical protein
MQNKRIKYWKLGPKKIFFLFLFFFIFILYPSSLILAQHTRLYACALGSNDPAAFMGGSSIGGGLWQSDDSGKTWKQLGWKHVKCYSVDIVNTSNGKIIYQACGNGVLKSTDAGATWRILTDWRITEVMDIAVDQKSPKNIYIATPGAIWKSDDGGDNWYETDSDIPYPIFVSRIKIDPTNHQKIYAATESGLYESKDGGLSWEKRAESGESVREMIVTAHGLSAWVENEGFCIAFENKKWVHGNLKNNLWAVVRAQNKLFFGGANGAFSAQEIFQESPKNVHSLTTIGDNIFIGSLNDGVWKYDLSKPIAPCEKMGLNNLQIWRLKAVEIK